MPGYRSCHQKQLAKERAVFILHFLVKVHHRKVRTGTQGRDLEEGTKSKALGKNTAYWLGPQGLLNFLTAPSATSQGVILTTLSWANPMAAFSQLGFAFSDDPLLCQVDIKTSP